MKHGDTERSPRALRRDGNVAVALALAVGMCVAGFVPTATPASAAGSTGAPNPGLAAPFAQTFTAGNECQSYTVPPDVNQIDVDLTGGNGFPGSGPGSPGGRGGHTTVRLNVNANSTLQVVVGGNGGGTGTESKGGGARNHGGGGGDSDSGSSVFSGGAYGGGGGGASFLSTDDAHCYSTGATVNGNDVLAVAGGGGGGGAEDSLGDDGGAGGDAGQAGASVQSCVPVFGCDPGGTGGGAGGSNGGGAGGAVFGSSGAALSSPPTGSGTNWLYQDGGSDAVDNGFGGGGGGGWYGGGQGGDQAAAFGGGGGGSDYVQAGAVAANSTPSLAVNTTGTAPQVTITTVATRLLTVTTIGTGSGTVTSSDSTIGCGTTCSSYEPTSAMVTLTATTVAGNRFAGWTGDLGEWGSKTTYCGASPTCTLPMDQARTVTATFNQERQLTVVSENRSPAGNGTITAVTDGSGPFPCGTGCWNVDAGATVTLTETPDTSSVFLGWQGADQGGTCTGTAVSCTVKLTDRDEILYSSFMQNVLSVQKVGNGSGTITGTNLTTGKPCATSDCSGSVYPDNTQILLTATADPGSTMHWASYPCQDPSPTCRVTVDGSETVYASFTKTPEILSLTVNGSGAGTIVSDLPGIRCSVSCGGTSAFYDQLSTVTLTETPQTGTPYNNSTFSGWSGCDSTTATTCTVNIQSARSVTATFTVIPQQSLQIAEDGAGSGTVTSDIGGINCGDTCIQSYLYRGTVVTLTAAPNTATSTFSGWSGCTPNPDGTCTLTMTNDATVHAAFTLIPRLLTTTKAGNGGGTLTCSDVCNGTYDNGSVVVVQEVPNSNSTFAGWSGACSGMSTLCTVTMGQAQSVTATFTRNLQTLTVATAGAGGGVVTSDLNGSDGGPAINCGTTCAANYDRYTSVTLTASPTYLTSRVASWSGICAGSGATCSVFMDQAKTITVNFELNHLAVTKDGGGTGTIHSTDSAIDCGTSCSANYSTGTSVTLTATADPGSTFEGWAYPCSGTNNCVVTVAGATTMNATFTTTPAIHIALAGTGAANGNVNGTGGLTCGTSGTTCDATYAIGTPVSLYAQGAPGTSTSFTGWSGACSGTNPTCSFTPTDSVSATANFTHITSQVSVTTAGTGAGTVASSLGGISCGTTCSGTVGVDDAVTLTATPNANSTFTGWSGACSGTSITCSFATVPSNITATATFTAKPAFTLTTGSTGTGHSTITSDVGGITCGSTCSATYQAGSFVWLTATAGAHTTFNNWSGNCYAYAGSNGNQCEVLMSNAQTMTASFTLSTQYIYAGGYYLETGSGTVTSDVPGINCAAGSNGGCGASFEQGTIVTLTAVPDANSTFTHWSNVTCQNSDSATTGKCQVLNTAGANPQVTFTHNPITVTYKADGGGGTGTIEAATATGAALNCTFHCTASYVYQYGPGYNIIAYAQPDPNMKFVRWSGLGCSTSQYCLVSPWDTNLTLTAEFEPITQSLSVQMRTNDSGSGSGSFIVNSTAGESACSGTCVLTVDQGETVTLTALDGTTGTFNRWVTGSGSCGTARTCTLPVGPGTVSAAIYFDGVPTTLAVNTTGAGSGQVTSNIGGISCGNACSTTLPYGYSVELLASPSPGSAFTGWTGDAACDDSSTSCVVSLNQDKNVTATFGLAPHTLTVTTDGTGSGKVTSDVDGIDCGSTCSAQVDANDDVALTATPDSASSTFAGWSGDLGSCASDDANCTVTMDQARTIDATFTLIPRHLSVTTDGTGTGDISSDPAGIDCGVNCASEFDDGTAVTLTATPDAGSAFTGWTGDCSGTDQCTVTLDTAHSVGATFTLLPQFALDVATAGDGSGTVTNGASTIDCGTDGNTACSHTYPSDAVITLTAVPTDALSVFTGWTGDCTGTDDTCTVDMLRARTVTATFAVVTIPSTATLSLSAPTHQFGAASVATVTVTGGTAVATGTVKLLDGAKVIATATLGVGSTAKLAIPRNLTVGTHHLTAAYVGAVPLQASTSATKTLTVVKARSAVIGKLSKASISGSAKRKITVTITAGGAAVAGRVNVEVGSKVIGHGSVKNGRSIVTLPKLAKGTHKIRLVYLGSTTVAGATSKPITLRVR